MGENGWKFGENMGKGYGDIKIIKKEKRWGVQMYGVGISIWKGIFGLGYSLKYRFVI